MTKRSCLCALALFLSTMLLTVAAAEAPIACDSSKDFKIQNAGATSSGYANPTLACDAAKILLQAALIIGSPGCGPCDIPGACTASVSYPVGSAPTTSHFYEPATMTFGCTARYTGKYTVACSKCEKSKG